MSDCQFHTFQKQHSLATTILSFPLEMLAHIMKYVLRTQTRYCQHVQVFAVQCHLKTLISHQSVFMSSLLLCDFWISSLGKSPDAWYSQAQPGYLLHVPSTHQTTCSNWSKVHSRYVSTWRAYKGKPIALRLTHNYADHIAHGLPPIPQISRIPPLHVKHFVIYDSSMHTQPVSFTLCVSLLHSKSGLLLQTPQPCSKQKDPPGNCFRSPVSKIYLTLVGEKLFT